MQTARSVHVATGDANHDGRVGNAITARIAATRSRLLDGGLLQPVDWGVVVPQDPPDPRGRKVYEYSPLDAFIEQRPALDRSTIDTDRADDTVLIILDPVAITDEHLFRWGDPPHVYKIKAVDGLLQDEETGTRYASEVTVIR